MVGCGCRYRVLSLVNCQRAVRGIEGTQVFLGRVVGQQLNDAAVDSYAFIESYLLLEQGVKRRLGPFRVPDLEAAGTRPECAYEVAVNDRECICDVTLDYCLRIGDPEPDVDHATEEVGIAA